MSMGPALLIALLASAGCDLSPLEQDAPVLLEGTLVPSSPEVPVGGSAAAVTQFGHTDVSILANGLDPTELYEWHLRQGTCEGAGEPVASPDLFPPLEPDADGEAGDEAGFSIPLVSGEPYAVEVGRSPDGADDVVACADMLESG